MTRMDQETNVLEPAAAESVEPVASLAPDETVDELLIEEISIDGMCGVY